MLRHSPFVALALSLSIMGSAANAAPPTNVGDRGQTARLRANERRALDSRQRLFERAAAASQSRTVPTLPTAADRPVPDQPTAVPTSPESAQSLGRGLSRRPVGPPVSPGSAGAPQSATRGLTRDLLPSLGRRSRPTLPQRATARRASAVESRRDTAINDRSRRTDGLAARGTRPQRPAQGSPDRILATRLAQIDRLRDTALEKGNDELLQQADNMERLAREQHERRLTAGVRRANRPDENRRESGEAAGDNANSGFGRLTATAAAEGRRDFGSDMAEDGRSRRPDVTRGATPDGEPRSRRTFGESIRNGLRRIGTALRLPGQSRPSAE